MAAHSTRLRLGPLAAASLGIAIMVGACAPEEEDKYVERPVGTLYNAGMNALTERNYKEAAKQFDEVERQHPYSIWATKAELLSAYSHYLNNEYQDAINALNRFVQLHPGNRYIVYAYYLRALSYYEQVTDVERDQSSAEQAMTSLQELVRRYPDSAYARDARQKIDLVRNHLAGKEMQIGRYYQKHDMMLAAINRFRNVVDKYQTTAQVPEAMERLVECYTSLGLVEEARKVAVVLGYNYPRSAWYADSYDLVHDLTKEGGVEVKFTPQPKSGAGPAELGPPGELTGTDKAKTGTEAAAPEKPAAADATNPAPGANQPTAGAPEKPAADAAASPPSGAAAPEKPAAAGAEAKPAEKPAAKPKGPEETTAEVGKGGPDSFLSKVFHSIF